MHSDNPKETTMSNRKLDLVLRQLAQAAADDDDLHAKDSTLQERVESHERLSRLGLEAARLREEPSRSAATANRRDKGIRLFPRGN